MQVPCGLPNLRRAQVVEYTPPEWKNKKRRVIQPVRKAHALGSLAVPWSFKSVDNIRSRLYKFKMLPTLGIGSTDYSSSAISNECLRRVAVSSSHKCSALATATYLVSGATSPGDTVNDMCTSFTEIIMVITALARMEAAARRAMRSCLFQISARLSPGCLL